MTIANRRFSMERQHAFAALSGDINPIHLDSVAARLLISGAIIVHGMHTLLWALNALAESSFRPAGIRAIDVRFPNALHLDNEVTLSVHKADANVIGLRVHCAEKVIASINLTCQQVAPCAPFAPYADESTLVAGGTIRDVPLEEMVGCRGVVDFAAPTDDFRAAFPAAASLLGAARLRTLAACSRIVGMDYPGVRSIFSRLTVEFNDEIDIPQLGYEVSEIDARFNIVRLTVMGAGLQGRIEAFSLPAAKAQPDMAELSNKVGADRFAQQTALVIGGSRGLGALTAKAIAAGGARVIVSYAVGKNEAQQVAEEIRGAGGHAEIMEYDVRQPAGSQLERLKGARPTHIYYFATGRIFKQHLRTFDRDTLDDFLAFYVYGVADLVDALQAVSAGPLTLFYPSSIAVEERPRDMTEYAMAKAAGEVLCSDLARFNPRLRVVVERLPRLDTEQTQTIRPQQLPAAIDVLLPSLLRCASVFEKY
jgi:NAD(P)-dependent dehydrogenase (short-subunit alcohol dehydrogenase family)